MTINCINSHLDDQPCHIILKSTAKLSHPVICLDRVIYCDEQKYACTTHLNDQENNSRVDIYDANFRLGPNDKFNDQYEQTFLKDGDGIIKIGKYRWKKSAFATIWSSFVINKKIAPSLHQLINNCIHHYHKKISIGQFVKLQQIFGTDGITDTTKKIIGFVLPSYDTISRRFIDFFIQNGMPIITSHKSKILKKGTRWIGYDATFRIAKSISLGTKYTRVALLTILDEWGDFIDFKLLNNAAEKHDYLVPILAQCVYGSLTTGPYRREHFMFCSDNSRRDKNLPKKVFDYVQSHLNHGNSTIKAPTGEIYDLKEMGEKAKV